MHFRLRAFHRAEAPSNGEPDYEVKIGEVVKMLRTQADSLFESRLVVVVKKKMGTPEGRSSCGL